MVEAAATKGSAEMSGTIKRRVHWTLHVLSEQVAVTKVWLLCRSRADKESLVRSGRVRE